MIVPMKKISVAGINKEKFKLLQFLSKYGVVQITSNLPDEVKRKDFLSELSENEKKLKRTKLALKILNEYDFEKKPFFTERLSVNEKEFFSESDNIYDDVNRIVRSDEKLEFLKNRLSKLQNERDRLLPYENWNVALDKKGTKETRFEIGFFPCEFNEKEFEAETKDLFLTIQKLSENNNGKYFGFAVHKVSHTEFSEILKKYSFTKMTEQFSKENLPTLINTLNIKINNTNKKIEHYKENLQKYVSMQNNIKKYHDLTASRVEVLKANVLSVSTSFAYVINGYVPESESEKIKKDIEENFNAVIEVSEIPKGEDFPVAMHNPKIIAPFEVVTEMYSTPSPYGIDPSKVMAPFYFIFFGMMLSDAGYGILLSLVTLFILKKMKPPEGQFKKMCSLLFMCGISTTIFGIIFGSFFSDVISTVSLGKLTQWALINPMEDPMTVLIIGYVLGAVHILTGLGVKAYMLIKDGKALDALFDIGSWYLVFIGIGMLIIPSLSAYGIYPVLLGVVMLILTQGRNEKNILKRLMSGILSLYDVTGYLSDILSYSRLLALGLSTAVVGMVINKMGSMGASNGWNASSVVIFTLVFILGHTFNIVINVLGSYVHTCRLMYIEFFNKFFEGGGKIFKPLKIKNKYTKLEE